LEEYAIQENKAIHDKLQEWINTSASQSLELESAKKEIAELKEKVNELTMADMTHEYNNAEAEKFQPEYERQIKEPLEQEIERLKGLVRFQMPTDEQIAKAAIVFNDGRIDEEELTNMISLCLFVVDRLYDNGDIMIPSSKEKNW